MKKQILALSVLAALSGCQFDNSDALQVPANFNNEFETQVDVVGFPRPSGEGMVVELTTGHGSAEGTLVITDVNLGEANLNYERLGEADADISPDVPGQFARTARVLKSTYGTFKILQTAESYSEWTYELDAPLNAENPEGNQKVADILENPDGLLEDSIQLISLDGTVTTLTFNIRGVAPAEPTFAGASTANASVSTPLAGGKTRIYDPNYNESKFVVQTGVSSTNGYGTFSIAEDGQWTFEVGSHPDLDALEKPEDKVTDSFTITSVDGNQYVVDVNIFGAIPNFAAEIPSSATDDNLFVIDFLSGGLTGLDGQEVSKDDLRTGKLRFKARVKELAADARIAMTCGNWNTTKGDGGEARRLAAFWVRPDGEFRMYAAKPVKHEKFPVEPGFTIDKWMTIELTWDYNSASQLTYMTLAIDDVYATSSHSAIPADHPNDKIVSSDVSLGSTSITSCLEEVRFYVPKNADNGGAGALYIDDIELYSNIDTNPINADTEAAFVERFANSADGDSVLEINSVRYTSTDATTADVKVRLVR